MPSKFYLAALLCIGLPGCSTGVAGVVLDGDTRQPVSGAELTLEWSGWGWSNDQLVWDAPKQETVRSGAAGEFAFRRDGGTRLNVVAPGYPPVSTGLCSHAAPVFVGGPLPGIELNERLLVSASDDRERTHEEDIADGEYLSSFGLKAGGQVFTGEGSQLALQSLGKTQMVFVRGIGATPAPPPRGWRKNLAIDLLRDCGWIFVGQPAIPAAVIRTGSYGSMEDGTDRLLMLSYALLR